MEFSEALMGWLSYVEQRIMEETALLSGAQCGPSSAPGLYAPNQRATLQHLQPSARALDISVGESV
jgi:hypothetical protein